MIAERLRELGFDADGFDPLAKGYGPLFKYLDSLETTVERVAAGQFTREAIAVVKNRQFIEFCDRAGDRVTATLYRDVIEPDERFHHELGRRLLLALGHDAGGAGGRPAARRPARSRSRRSSRRRRSGPRASTTPRAADGRRTRRWPLEFAAAVERPDAADRPHARRPRSSPQSEYPDARRRGHISTGSTRSPRRARTSRAVGDPLGAAPPAARVPLRGGGLLRQLATTTSIRATAISTTCSIAGSAFPITLSLVLIEVGRRLGLEMEGIGLPGHFITGARVDGEQVLLDPFDGGAILTAESCRRGRGARARPAGPARPRSTSRR